MGKREELWTRYAETQDPGLREEIIVENMPLVRYVLGRLTIPVLEEEVYNDLVGYGVLGLIDAVDRFEPERGLRFSTYATLRIRGCILDALRAMDILPRAARQRVKEIERAVSRLRMRLGREPQEAEVASAANLDLKAYRAALIEANCAVLSIDTPIEVDGDENAFSFREFLCDKDLPDPEEVMERTELEQRLEDALRRLPQRTQLLLSLYYYEGLTMREIGQVLDLSESRVSQLHARAIKNLRAALEQDQTPSPNRAAFAFPQTVAATAWAAG